MPPLYWRYKGSKRVKQRQILRRQWEEHIRQRSSTKRTELLEHLRKEEFDHERETQDRRGKAHRSDEHSAGGQAQFPDRLSGEKLSIGVLPALRAWGVS